MPWLPPGGGGNTPAVPTRVIRGDSYPAEGELVTNGRFTARLRRTSGAPIARSRLPRTPADLPRPPRVHRTHGTAANHAATASRPHAPLARHEVNPQTRGMKTCSLTSLLAQIMHGP